MKKVTNLVIVHCLTCYRPKILLVFTQSNPIQIIIIIINIIIIAYYNVFFLC